MPTDRKKLQANKPAKEGSAGPASPAERQRKRRARIAEERGAIINVALSPAAAAKLSLWVANGETATAVINRLLTRSKPPTA